MKIVADESVDRQIVDALRSEGHAVIFIAELDPGIDDTEVLTRSRDEHGLLITADKDFGELVFHQHLTHEGILLIRLAGLTSDEKARLVVKTFADFGEQLKQQFGVLFPRALRLRKRIPPG